MERTKVIIMEVVPSLSSQSCQLPPAVFRTVLNGRRVPLVIKGQLTTWMTTRSWSPQELCTLLCTKRTTFKICPRRGTEAFQHHFQDDKGVVYETQCEFVDATYSDFHAWLTPSEENDVTDDAEKPIKAKQIKIETPASEQHTSSSSEQTEVGDNPLMKYPKSEYWIYADYKYMCHLCNDIPELLSAVDWSLFGFDGRDGEKSTLWIGSEGAYTPCHYDTYGCNLVAQLSGRKKWTLFSPTDSDKLYPTRIPYEESSVFSGVNVTNPDLKQCPKFAGTTAYEVVLEPGDVLFVPRQWWHYVESVGGDATVSVNTWIELHSDVHERLKEAIVRTLVSAFSKESPNETRPEWINPNEELFSTEENIRLLSLTLEERRQQMSDSSTVSQTLTTKDFLHAMTSNEVVDIIAKKLVH